MMEATGTNNAAYPPYPSLSVVVISTEKPAPDFTRAQARLARLYETNRQAFAGVVGMIDFGLKPSEAEEPAKKAKAG